MNYTFINSGIREEVSFSQSAVDGIFLPLLRDLTALHREKGGRILVFLAAPPGAGKSTLSDFLQHLSKNTPGIDGVTAIGMDGFHRYQDYLLTHTTVRDGTEIPMVKVKGAPETFDLPLLRERIRALKAEDTVGWPRYDRLLHNPVENAVSVSGGIVLLEGNYLLLDLDGWRDLRSFADYTVMLTADEALLRRRLIARKMTTGVSREDSERFVDFSDMHNVRLCLAHPLPADLTLRSEEIV